MPEHSRVIVLVDGEHYPPVTRWGIDVARSRGHEVAAALYLGGTEKIGADRAIDLGGIDVHPAGTDPLKALAALLEETGADGVLDLSDEPVVGFRLRFALASVALAAGRTYHAAGMRLDPPWEGPPLPVPTVAVIGAGKRTGKTAVAAQLARLAAEMGAEPVIVAMGRGGPPEPQVAEAGSIDLDRLRELVKSGAHAASDYLEDALTTGLMTIGARRCGGGPSGAPYATNVREAAALVPPGSLAVLEGSGASIPPIPWDAGVLVVPAALDPEILGGYLGPLKLLLSDVVVFTMATGPGTGPEHLDALRSHVHRFREDARIVVTEFVPTPLKDVRGRRVFFATTASPAAVDGLVQILEEEQGCRVVGTSSKLADRAGLTEDLQGAPDFDVLLTELKGAAVDVAAERALEGGAEVTFLDNRARTVEGPPIEEALREAVTLAREAARRRGT